MNIGPSDLVKGIELALRIYRFGFVAENAAGKKTSPRGALKPANKRIDRRYHAFREDINDFQSLLSKLNQSLQSAQRRFSRRGPTLGPRPYDPLSRDFERERKAIVGPFLRTLQDCQSYLDANKALRVELGRQSSPLQNLQWHFSQQDQQIDGLRRRLQFHSEKIRFVIDRLSLDILTDLDAKADDLLAIAESNLAVSSDILLELNRFRSSLFGFFAGQGSLEDPNLNSPPIASAAIAAKFHASLSVNPPPIGPDESALVREFNALLSHFQESVSSSDQTPEQYLLLLKVTWLLDHIKGSKHYQEARPGLYYRRAIDQIERAILARARTPSDVISYDAVILTDLPDACFRIWSATAITATRNVPPDQLMPRANEQKVAHMELAHDDGPGVHATVSIFKKSNEQFRVVQEITSSLLDQKVIMPQQIDTSQDKMIPRYALPTLENPCLEIAMFSRNEETLYTFSSLADVSTFQSAFTGYDVSFDQAKTNIRCQFSEDVKSLDCLARVQVWQDPIVLAPTTDDGGITQIASAPTLSRGSQSRQGSLVPSIAASTNLIETSGGWQGGPPHISAITLFTQICVGNKKRFAIIFVELQEGVYIRPEECNCHLNYDTCSKLVLGRQRQQKFPVRVCFSGADAEGRPGPNTFDLFPLRLPRGPAFDQLPVKHTEYVVLKFQSLQEKSQFHQELELRFRIRDKQIRDQRTVWRGIKIRSDHPERHDRIGAQNTARSPQSHHLFAASSFAAEPSVTTTTDSIRRQSHQLDPMSMSTSPSTTSSGGAPLSAATSADSSQFGGSVDSDVSTARYGTTTSTQPISLRAGARKVIARVRSAR